MTLRSIVLWGMASVLLAWIGMVAFETRRCQTSGGQFAILGWRCVLAKPSIILRRDLERT